MRYTISGKNINITPGLKDAVESKLGKLERYFSPDTEVQVTLSVEKGRQKIEVTIPVKGSIIRAEQDSSDMYVSVELYWVFWILDECHLKKAVIKQYVRP